jgi:hypothetical protein
MEDMDLIVKHQPCECSPGSPGSVECAVNRGNLYHQSFVLDWVLGQGGDETTANVARIAEGLRQTLKPRPAAVRQTKVGEAVDHHMAKAFNVTAAADPPHPPIVGLRFTFGDAEGETVGLTMRGAEMLHQHLGEVIEKVGAHRKEPGA